MELFTRHLGPGTLRTRAFAPLALFSLVVLARPAIAQMCSESSNCGDRFWLPEGAGRC